MLLRRLGDFIIFSNIYVALPIVALTLLTYQKTNLPHSFSFLVYVYMSSLALYSFHRIYGVIRAGNTDSARFKWVASNMKLSGTIGGVALLISIFAFIDLFTVDFLKWMLVPVILAVGYSINVVPTRSGLKRLRDFGVAKPIFIAGVVALVTGVLPLVVAEADRSIAHFFNYFLFLIGITIPFDIRDMLIDESEGVRTIPVLFGERKATVLAIAFVVISGAFEPITIGSVLTIVVTAGIIYKANRKASPVYYALILEGAMILKWVSYVFFS